MLMNEGASIPNKDFRYERLELKSRGRIYTWFNQLCKNPYFLAGPACLLSLCFTVFPILYGFVVSFGNWNVLRRTFRFVGLDNYIYIFSNPDFWMVIKNTLTLVVCFVGFSFLFNILLATFMNKNTPARNLVSTIMFTPHIISTVSIAVVFLWLMDAESGVFNAALEWLGLEKSYWVYDSSTSLMSIIIVMIWKYMGYSILIIVSGLRSIPDYVYEAARLDGTKKRKIFFTITIPLLSPTLFFLLITMTTEAFCSFDMIQLMTRGGPNNASNTLAYYIYQTGFQFVRIGQAMAAAMVLLVLVVTISLVNIKFFSKRIYY